MKQLLSFLSLIFIFLACASETNRSKPDANNFNQGSLVNDSLKLLISDSSKQKFASNYVFGLKMVRLNRSTIINIEPVRDRGYINENGYPLEYFENGGSLFLVYCGIETSNTGTLSINKKLNDYRVN